MLTRKAIHFNGFRRVRTFAANAMVDTETTTEEHHLTALLKATTTHSTQLKEIHAQILRTGKLSNYSMLNRLVITYASENLEDARKLFDSYNPRNPCIWNTLIKSYAKNCNFYEALVIFSKMHSLCLRSDQYTLPVIIKSCYETYQMVTIKGIHGHLIVTGFVNNVFIDSSLVDAYAKLGHLEYARQVFEEMCDIDVAAWTAMLTGYAQNGYGHEAIDVYKEMKDRIVPNSMTFTAVLSACGILRDLKEGMRAHCEVLKRGHRWNAYVGSTIVDMYGKCGNVVAVKQAFKEMPERNVVSWSAVISAHATNGYGEEALGFFRCMYSMEHVKPNLATMVSVLLACSHVGAPLQGKKIHAYVTKCGLDKFASIGNGLVDMYAKCGNVNMAREVFDFVPVRDTVTWSAMIVGYGLHGHSEEALELFRNMIWDGSMKPNHITFIGVLAACSHSGKVCEGIHYFDVMMKEYNVEPDLKHYACMVDLLGRAGRLDEAYDLIKAMPMRPDAGVWGALLGASRMHCNVRLGEIAAQNLFALQPENIGFYVLLSNIYAAAGKWDDVVKVRAIIKEKGLRKPPGCSFIEIQGQTHGFISGDKSHPRSREIYAMLATLSKQMKDAGYEPDTSFVLQDLDKDVKERMLSSHGERLAIMFGLICTGAGVPLHITKNIRVCGDCHTAIKFISKIVMREIIVRDTNRFHHFKDGVCSCGDYW